MFSFRIEVGRDSPIKCYCWLSCQERTRRVTPPLSAGVGMAPAGSIKGRCFGKDGVKLTK